MINYMLNIAIRELDREAAANGRIMPSFQIPPNLPPAVATAFRDAYAKIQNQGREIHQDRQALRMYFHDRLAEGALS